ncbi:MULTISPECIES: hypothetical protein [Mesorhizobium]|uniref:hypothetical protein n=1 Tax=Mesorhizobium australicum TaxID=536018 RepID=UPI00333C46C0
MEQSDLQPDEAVRAAAEFLASPRERSGQACVPELRTRYGLTTPEAIEAIRLANALRLARAH